MLPHRYVVTSDADLVTMRYPSTKRSETVEKRRFIDDFRRFWQLTWLIGCGGSRYRRLIDDFRVKLPLVGSGVGSDLTRLAKVSV